MWVIFRLEGFHPWGAVDIGGGSPTANDSDEGIKCNLSKFAKVAKFEQRQG